MSERSIRQMRGVRGFTRLVVVLVATMTLLWLAAVGAAAASGKLGSDKGVAAVVKVVAPNSTQSANTTGNSKSKGDESKGDNRKHKGECHPPKKAHKHGTPGHKN